jgi:enoyl-CoA hydratase/carnithine racemase
MSGTESTGLVRERRGAIELFRLEREARMNALDDALVAALEAALADAAADPELRALVITGAGERAFCAGADLKQRSGMSDAQVRGFLDALRRVFDGIDRFPRPVIAAINGLALGGGLELALACDFRVVAQHAQLGLSEVSLAVLPGAGGTQRLPRLIGEARAKEVILLGERIDAARALEWGLVHRIADDALGAALTLAERFAQLAPIAVAAALEALEVGRELPLPAGLDVERACYEKVLASEDRREALRAFAEKRKPSFRGR